MCPTGWGTGSTKYIMTTVTVSSKQLEFIRAAVCAQLFALGLCLPKALLEGRARAG